MYFNSDPAVSEADLHVLSGAMAFGGADTLGAGAFWGISRSVLEAVGLERDEDRKTIRRRRKRRRRTTTTTRTRTTTTTRTRSKHQNKNSKKKKFAIFEGKFVQSQRSSGLDWWVSWNP
jgi:hypothetical protein